MNIKHFVEEKIIVVEFTEEIDHHSSEKIRKRLDYEIQRFLPKKIILDFQKVSFMDSAGIGLILGRYNEYRLDHITLVLVGVNRSIKKLFIISGINQLMDMYESVNIGG